MLPKGLLKEYSHALSYVLRGLDVSAIFIAGLLAYYWKFGDIDLPDRYFVALIIATGLTPWLFRFFNIYESIRAKSFGQHLRSLAKAICALLVLLAGLAFFTKKGDDFSRGWFALWSFFSFILLISFRGSLLISLRFMRSRGWNERRVVILGTGDLRDKLTETVQEAIWTGFRIVALLEDNTLNAMQKIEGVAVVPTPTDLSGYLKQNEIDEIWLVLPLSAEDRIKSILHELRHLTVTTRLVLDIFGLDLLNHSIAHLAGFPVLNIRGTPMTGVNRFTKAVEDRVLASLILLCISPLLLLIAIAVKCSSPGPIFYRQKRISWNGKEFDMLKFRTMPVDAEAKTGPVWAKSGETRATKTGAFLRKTSLDELPQFINVLYGDMSIVGPRPERLVFVEEFKDKIPGYMQKHLVKAGITGWAQVNGWRGNTSLEKRIEYDLYYIENWSLWFDLKIIFLTFFQGFVHKNAY